jgi:hypothetical protein
MNLFTHIRNYVGVMVMMVVKGEISYLILSFLQILEIKTEGESPEGRPKNVRVLAVSSSEIQVTWEYPEKDTWHGDLLGYYVGYRRYRFVCLCLYLCVAFLYLLLAYYRGKASFLPHPYTFSCSFEFWPYSRFIKYAPLSEVLLGFFV